MSHILHKRISATQAASIDSRTRSPSNVAEFLLDGKQPTELVLLFPDAGYTYGELRLWTNAFAAFLMDNGGSAGDRVILVGENSLFWVAAYLGAMRAGLVAVPLPAEIPSPDLRHVLQTTEARFAFLQCSFAAKYQAEFRGVITAVERAADEGLRSSVTADDIYREYQGREPAPACASGDDLAALMFTSGSTGTPRGVMISHANIVANTLSIIDCLRLTARDRVMVVLPFHYCFGASLLHTHLRVGGSLVVDHRFMFPEVVLRRLRETHCTGFAGVPSHYQILLRRSGLRHMSFPSLRYVQQAGGHLAPALVRELRQALPGTEVFVMYGQTEATARLSCLPPEHLDTKPGSIGCGISGVTLTVVNESGHCVKPGEVGEIVAEGENVGRGYWGDAQDDAACFRDGKLYTGDLATIDDEGFIYIVDRMKDFVKCGSKRISCRLIEEHLLECAEIVEAAVVGIPDETLGEAVQAFIVPREGAATDIPERVQVFCKEHLPHQLVPRRIVIVQSLPKNSAGKILKSSLKRLATQAAAVASLQSDLTRSSGVSYADRCAPSVGRDEMAGN